MASLLKMRTSHEDFGGVRLVVTLLGASSAQSSADHLGVLPEIHHTCDDDALPLDRVEDTERKPVNEQAPVAPEEHGGNLWKRTKTSETQIQMPHEKFAASRLIRLVEFVAGLDVGIGGEQED